MIYISYIIYYISILNIMYYKLYIIYYVLYIIYQISYIICNSYVIYYILYVLMQFAPFPHPAGSDSETCSKWCAAASVLFWPRQVCLKGGLQKNGPGDLSGNVKTCNRS